MPRNDSRSTPDSNGQKRGSVRPPARESILAEFTRAVFSGKHRSSGVADVAKNANVARSTFYEHFEGKRDLLRAAVEPIFVPVAEVAAGRRSAQALLPILAHVRGQESVASDFFTGPDRAVIEAALADLIEERLPTDAVAIPRSLLARVLAFGQLALLTGWLMEHSAYDPHRLAAAMARAAEATRRAFLATDGA